MTEQTLPAPAPATPQHQLTGRQRVAALMITIGTSAAANVLSKLPPEAAEKIAEDILNTKRVIPQVRDQVLEETYAALYSHMADLQGGPSYALELFIEAYGENKGMELLEKVTSLQFHPPFEFLLQADPLQVAQLLEGEHPQTIAIVLAHLEARAAARILPLLDPQLQVEVARRIAVTEKTTPEAVKVVEDGISMRMTTAVSESTQVGGTKQLAAVLNQMSTTYNKEILSGLREINSALEEDVRRSMFIFEDVKLISDRDMQKVSMQLDQKDVALALQGADQVLKDKFLKAVSQRSAEMLRDEMSILEGGRPRQKNIDEARNKIVDVIKAMEDREELFIDRGGDDEL